MKPRYLIIFFAMLAFVAASAQRFTNELLPEAQSYTDTSFDFKKGLNLRINSDASIQDYPSDGQWQTIGTGTFDDHIFGDGPRQVTIQESTAIPGMYRLPDIWTCISAEAKPLLIDATDSDFVIIPEQETGIYYEGSGYLSVISHTQELIKYYYTLDFLSYSYKVKLIRRDYPNHIITFSNGFLSIPANALRGTFPEKDDKQFYSLSDEYSNVLFPGAGPIWSETAQGEILDTFFESYFSKYTDYVAEVVPVDIQKHNYVEGIYRVLDPWKALQYGTPPMFIDASNPDLVVVPRQPSGIVGDEDFGIAHYQSFSFYFDSPREFMERYHGSFNITMKDNVINFTPTEVNVNGEGRRNASPFLLRFPSSNNYIYYVYSEDPTAGYIKLPEFTGVSSVAVDDDSSPLEIYNLSGQKVSNPVSGQLYIVKKGNTVRKIIKK